MYQLQGEREVITHYIFIISMYTINHNIFFHNIYIPNLTIIHITCTFIEVTAKLYMVTLYTLITDININT